MWGFGFCVAVGGGKQRPCRNKFALLGRDCSSVRLWGSGIYRTSACRCHADPPVASAGLQFLRYRTQSVTSRLKTLHLRSRNASRRSCAPLRLSRLQRCEPRSMQQFTYVRKALKSRPGKLPLVWLGLRPMHRAAMSPPITCVDGRGMRPLPAMSARSRRTFLTCRPRPERCCCRRLARTPRVPSTCCLRTTMSSSPVFPPREIGI